MTVCAHNVALFNFCHDYRQLVATRGAPRDSELFAASGVVKVHDVVRVNGVTVMAWLVLNAA